MKQTALIFTVFRKDFLCHIRSAAISLSIPFFALLVMVVFAFAFNASELREGREQTAAGIIWVAITFAGVIGLGETFAEEKENDCLKGLLLCPVERPVLFLGKLLGSFSLILLTEAVITPIFFVLFGVSCRILDLALVILLATVGLSVVGTLFSAISGASQMREVLFPLLFFPLVVPVVIAGVGATGALFAGGTLGDVTSWLEVLVAYDILFIAISVMLFETTVEE